MSNWTFIERHRVTEPVPSVHPRYCSTKEDGWNGMFRFVVDGRRIRCVASDGLGWRHVSASNEDSDKPLPWSIMCKLKELFFEDDEWVVQFHPPASEYVNHHPGCLHLWSPTDCTLPVPESILVGPRKGMART